MTFASKGRKSYVDVVGRCLCVMHQATFLNTLSLSFIVSLFHTLTHSHNLTQNLSVCPTVLPISHEIQCLKSEGVSVFLFNFFLPTSGLTGLILNSIPSSRSSSDSVVTGLWSHRKVMVCFPAGTRYNSVLYFPHTVSYRVPRTPSLGIKRSEREANHHLVSRV